MATPEGPLREYLRHIDAGTVPLPDEALADYRRLHEQFSHSAPPAPSLAGRIRGEQSMLTALADSKRPDQRGGRRMIPTFLAAVPRAVLTALGAVALTGGAMTASAAVGGANIPATLLAALGVSNQQELDPGITGSNASSSGLDHANPNAADGAGNAADKGDNRVVPTIPSVVPTVMPDAAQTRVPDLAQPGTERANLGGANAAGAGEP